MSAIPIPGDFGGEDEILRKALAIPTGAEVRHMAMSNHGIPVTPQTSHGIIPTNRATGQPEELNDQGKAIAPGVAGLWTRAENIHNPILRTLGKIGAVGARAIDVAGSVAAPGLFANIPGTTLNQKVGENRALKQQTADEESQQRQATTEHEQAETGAIPAKTRLENAQADALDNPEPKPKEEQWEVMPGFQGPNGEPIVMEKNSGQMHLASAIPGIQSKKQDKPDNPEQQFVDEYQRTHPGATIAQAQRAHVLNNQAPQQPERPQRVLGVGPDRKVIEITPGMTLPEGTQTVGGEIKSGQSNQAAKDALAYATDYLASKKFTGAGDEALMEKYFELAKPSSGFRMTQPQIEMLTRAQDIMNSVVAKGKHLFSPEAPYFSPALREQIVETMTRIEGSKGAGKAKGEAGAPPAGAKVRDYTSLTPQ